MESGKFPTDQYCLPFLPGYFRTFNGYDVTDGGGIERKTSKGFLSQVSDL